MAATYITNPFSIMKWLLEFKVGKSSFNSPLSNFSVYIKKDVYIHRLHVCKNAVLITVVRCTIKFDWQHRVTFVCQWQWHRWTCCTFIYCFPQAEGLGMGNWKGHTNVETRPRASSVPCSNPVTQCGALAKSYLWFWLVDWVMWK